MCLFSYLRMTQTALEIYIFYVHYQYMEMAFGMNDASEAICWWNGCALPPLVLSPWSRLFTETSKLWSTRSKLIAPPLCSKLIIMLRSPHQVDARVQWRPRAEQQRADHADKKEEARYQKKNNKTHHPANIALLRAPVDSKTSA